MSVPRVTQRPGADDLPRPAAKNPPKSGCRCRNHLKKAKVQYPTRAAAVDGAIHNVLVLGYPAQEPYACPSSDRWHVRTALAVRRVMRT